MEQSIAALFGVVQGITEFWPISSSGHLVLLHAMVPTSTAASSIAFDVALHWGTLTALVVFFWSDIREVVTGAFRQMRRGKENREGRLFWNIVIGTIPAVVLGGWLVLSRVEETLRVPGVVATLLFAVAFLFLYAESRFSGKKKLWDITWRAALLIGTAQALALVPGISRSGITIVTAMLLGFERESAARFSFVLSIPAVFAAGILTLPDLADVSGGESVTILIGFLASAVAGIFALRFLMRFLKSGTLKPFAWYRIGLAVLLLLLALGTDLL